jgi:hypothetical protein
MYDFLIGGKTGASRSLAVHVFDRNSPLKQCARRPLPVRHPDSIPPCVFGAGSSSNGLSHFKLHSNREDLAWLPQ